MRDPRNYAFGQWWEMDDNGEPVPAKDQTPPTLDEEMITLLHTDG